MFLDKKHREFIDSSPTLLILFNLNYHFKGPVPKYSQWGLGFHA